MPYINGKRVTLDQWRAANPFQKWPPESEDETPEPEPETAPKKAVRKKAAVIDAIKQSTGVDVDDA